MCSLDSLMFTGKRLIQVKLGFKNSRKHYKSTIEMSFVATDSSSIVELLRIINCALVGIHVIQFAKEFHLSRFIYAFIMLFKNIIEKYFHIKQSKVLLLHIAFSYKFPLIFYKKIFPRVEIELIRNRINRKVK